MCERSVPSSVVTRLVLVRHGESLASVNRKIGGPRTCQGLTPLGFRQAEALRDRLERTGEIEADLLLASDYARARQTAEVIAPALGLPVEVDAGVGEHDPGPSWDGRGFDDYLQEVGNSEWERDPYLLGFPGGETLADFQHRVASALHAVVRQNEGRTIIVVCHGGVIDVAMRIVLRARPVGDFELHSINTGVTEALLTPRGRWRLLRYNDAAHLSGLGVDLSVEE
jgi:probable phosphoglycerate mutase